MRSDQREEQTRGISRALFHRQGDSTFTRMVPRKVVVTLLLLYMVAMLAKQSEGYLAFYTPDDFRKMQEKERNRAQKKSLTLQQQSDTGDFPELSEDEGQIIKLIAPVEIGIHLSKQLEKYQDVLKELLTEMLPDTQNVN
ncbi:promotilin [Lacerta agilis]|uniref:promotilin n=1 Tax=Lacerta agilis TaxID=80427 RepID=UPI001419CFBF|nr:promotilin [Lacerta agilis]